jgi:hypothetical protein
VHLRIPDEKTGLYEFSGMFWIVFFIGREVAIVVLCHMAISDAQKLQDNVQPVLLRQHVSTDMSEQLKMSV